MHIRKLTRQPPKKGKQANQILNTGNEHQKKKQQKNQQQKNTLDIYIKLILHLSFNFSLLLFVLSLVGVFGVYKFVVRCSVFVWSCFLLSSFFLLLFLFVCRQQRRQRRFCWSSLLMLCFFSSSFCYMCLFGCCCALFCFCFCVCLLFHFVSVQTHMHSHSHIGRERVIDKQIGFFYIYLHSHQKLRIYVILHLSSCFVSSVKIFADVQQLIVFR